VPLKEAYKGQEYMNLSIENLYDSALNEDTIRHYKNTLNDIAIQQQTKCSTE
jgi:hypothetical protein